MIQSPKNITTENSRYNVAVDNVTEPEWSDLMAHFDDANIYQTWAYGAVRWGQSNLSHLILKQNGRLAAIAQLRIIRPPSLKIGIAYLRWGPLCHLRTKELDPDVVRAFATAVREEYVDRRGLYLEILPNAFLETKRAAVFQESFEGFERSLGINSEQYRTFRLDLSDSLDELRRQLDKKWRNQLNAAERNNLSIREEEGNDAYKVFCDLYAQMRNRKKFDTSVSVEEFGRIQERLPVSEKMRIFICEYENQAIGGLVCSALGESAIYLLGATNENAMKLKASYRMQWAAIQWLKLTGIHYYDLGGIDPIENPGVYHFKEGLSGLDVSHMNALVACDNGLSRAFVKAGQAVDRSLRNFQQRFANG